jgi:hypothetical protein
VQIPETEEIEIWLTHNIKNLEMLLT